MEEAEPPQQVRMLKDFQNLAEAEILPKSLEMQRDSAEINKIDDKNTSPVAYQGSFQLAKSSIVISQEVNKEGDERNEKEVYQGTVPSAGAGFFQLKQ